MTEPTSAHLIEEKLYAANRMLPRPEFLAGLRARLGEQPPSPLTFSERVGLAFRRPAWVIGIATILILAAALIAVGPQRVLAQVQRWLNYVPGIGFVDLARTSVLVNPVESTRDGVTLRVSQVIAGPERTEIVISTPGLSENDFPRANNLSDNPDFTATLVLPDGSRLEARRWEIGFGSGKLEFPALPAGINQVTLIVPRLPLAPVGAFPEDWEIPLILRSATGELNNELFPQPYRPVDASDAHHGITLRVLDVAQTSTETAVHYQVEWTDPGWEFRWGLGADRRPELRDNLGQIYWESPRSGNSSVVVIAIPAPDGTQATPTPSTPNKADTLVFPPLSLSANQATLWVDALEFQVPAQGSLKLDLGETPQIGDSWPLDVDTEIAGFPVHLTGARLRTETVGNSNGQSKQVAILEFDLDPLKEQNGFSLTGFELANPEQGIYGSVHRTVSAKVEHYKGRLEFINGKIPNGTIELMVSGTTQVVHGPWQVTWAIPGKDPAKAVLPVHLFPEQGQAGSGVRPVIDEVFLSDRLTAIKLGAVGLPQGFSFVQVLANDPAVVDLYAGPAELYLEDNWGRRYEAGKNQAFIRPNGDGSGYDPLWRFFSPLEPLTQSGSLHIPGMEALTPGQAFFEVEVPQGVSFKPEEYPVTVISGGGPQHPETRTRQVSEPWPVDINIEIAGYRLHFTQARLEHEENSDPAYLLFLKGDAPVMERDGLRLNGLRFSNVERPDGEIFRIDQVLQNSGVSSYPYGPYGGIGAVAPGSNLLQASLGLNVTAANRVDLLPGRYRIEINGATVWVPGPWELGFSLSGR